VTAVRELHKRYGDLVALGHITALMYACPRASQTVHNAGYGRAERPFLRLEES